MPQTEWSSIDSVISAVALLAAQGSLGLDTSGSEELLRRIDWQDLEQSDGLSMGYTDSGELIPWTYNCFGGEQWLVALAHAAVTGQAAPVRYPSPQPGMGQASCEAISLDALAASFPSELSGEQLVHLPSDRGGQADQVLPS